MAICNDCRDLLGYDQQHQSKFDREIVSLMQSYRRCSFCRFFCDFFEIPVESICDDGLEWPTMEQMSSFNRRDATPPPPGITSECFVRLKRGSIYETSLGYVTGALISKGPSRSYSHLTEAKLPLGLDGAIYSDSIYKLGICMDSGM